MSPTIVTPFPWSAPPDLLIFDHAIWPQTIAGITRVIGTQRNERTAKATLTKAIGAMRGAAPPDADWTDCGTGVWSSIAPFQPRRTVSGRTLSLARRSSFAAACF